MNPTRKKRFWLIILIMLATAIAAVLVGLALQSNLNYLYSPSEVVKGAVTDGTKFRLGGVVLENSVVRQAGQLAVRFVVTDRITSYPVQYEGILPDMFQPGTSIIAMGKIENNCFVADKVLAKHDETYMPEEVARAIAQAQTNASAQTAEQNQQDGLLIHRCQSL